MDLNIYDLEILETIVNCLEKSSEITDLYITKDIISNLKMIIRKLKRIMPIEIEFECPKCHEFCYKKIEKNQKWYVPKCRSCQTRMNIIKV